MKLDLTPTFQVTPYGDVDAKALESLRESVDTTVLLKLVERFDQCRGLFADEGGLRDRLLRLHSMAHTVINSAPLTVPPNDTDIWEFAEGMIDDLRCIESLARDAAVEAEKIATLSPGQ
ncbi:MAG: Tn3 family transposase post-transcriptional regulator TnpC [Pseudomonadota bacterium]